MKGRSWLRGDVKLLLSMLNEMDIDRIIPPKTREHRDGFSNQELLDELSDEDLKELEFELLKRVQLEAETGKVDTLIISTLVYMHSNASVSILDGILNNHAIPPEKGVVLASSLFELTKSKYYVNLVVGYFDKIKSESLRMLCFSYLSKVNVPEVREILKFYTMSSDYLIAYHAKKSLDKMIN